MRQTIVPIFLILLLTACQERHAVDMPIQNTLPIKETSKTPLSDEIVEEKTMIKEDTPTIISKPNFSTEEKVTPIEVEKVEENLSTPTIKKSSPEKVETKFDKDQEIFSGGMMTDGLDIGTIRLGKEGTTTRLVLDSYKWNVNAKTPSVRSHETGYYTLTYAPKAKRITAIINGYRGFSALQGSKERLFGANDMVKSITMEKQIDDGFKFIIELKQEAKVNIFDIKGPGRLIVDMTRQ